jgi:hypothetical protein
VETRSRTTFSAGLLALLLLIAIVATVRDAGDTTGRPDEDGVLTVVIEDYRLQPDDLVVTAGEPFTLTIVNRDDASHHLSFGRVIVEDEGGREAGFAEDLFAGLDPVITPEITRTEPEVAGGGTTVLVAGGRTVSIRTTLPADRIGTWEAACFTGGGCHYRAGLAATLTVE